jgi:hypothetical protein
LIHIKKLAREWKDTKAYKLIWLSSGFSSKNLIRILLTILNPQLDRNDADNQYRGNKVDVVPDLTEVTDP